MSRRNRINLRRRADYEEREVMRAEAAKEAEKEAAKAAKEAEKEAAKAAKDAHGGKGKDKSK